MRICRDMIARSSQSLLEVLNILDKGGSQAALICDENDRLVGIVTDGDIRRGILKGASLDSGIREILKKDFYSCNPATSQQEALSILKSKGLRVLPVVGDEGTPLGIYHIDDLVPSAEISSPVVIMAGGFGTRLKPLTNTCPKPMLKIGNTPMLQLIIEHYAEQGFSEFYLSVHYMSNLIKDYFGDGAKFGVNINYIEETEPLGTAGSLSLLPEFNEPFIVTNGDVLTKVNAMQMLAFHNALNVSLTVGVKEYSHRVPYGVVDIQDGMLSTLEEKPVTRHQVNAGIYAFHPRILKRLPKDKAYDMTDVVQMFLSNKEPVSAFPIHEYWSDVGKFEELKLAQSEFAKVK